MITDSSKATILTVPTRPDGLHDWPGLLTILAEAVNHLTKKLPEDLRDVHWSITQDDDFVEVTVRWRTSE